jgi:hypothetical protein
VACVFGRCLAPVDEDGLLSVVNAGQAVPLTWRMNLGEGRVQTALFKIRSGREGGPSGAT